MNNIKKIIFCFPYRDVSGVPVLFSLLSDHIACNSSLEVYVVDYSDGYMARTRDPKKVKLIEYGDSNADIPEQSIMIFQSMTPWSIFPNLDIKSTTRLFFWTLHPNNFTPHLRFDFLLSYPRVYAFLYKTLFLSYRKKVISFVKSLNRSNSLAFMDANTLSCTNRYLDYRLLIKSPFLPVPVNPKYGQRFANENIKKDSEVLQIVSLGRFVDWKINLLIPAINEFSKFSIKRNIPIRMNIVGEGPAKSRLQDLELLNNKLFSINLIGRLEANHLDAFLGTQDIMIAMGTSALMGGMNRLPVIRVDISNKKVNVFPSYQLLYEGKGFTLGNNIFNRHQQKGWVIEDLLEYILSDYNEVSKKTYNYVNDNFNLTNIASQLLGILECSQYIYSDFSNSSLKKKGFIYSLLTRFRKLIRKEEVGGVKL